MCQLTYVSLSNRKPAALFALLAMTNNSKTNPDGWGTYSNGKVIKSALAAFADTDLENTLLGKGITTPLLCHVRKASLNAGKKEIIQANAHPFEKENIILAHNGTLTPDKVLPKEYDNMIDSEKFATRLDQRILANNDKDLPNNLRLEMDEWSGKFAFLIYDKISSRYYAARGWAAELYHTYFTLDGVQVGYVINTEQNSLIDSMIMFCKLQRIFGYNLGFTKVEELKKESIFSLGEDIVECGTIKENYAATTNTTYYNNKWPLKKDDGVKVFGGYDLSFIDASGLTIDELDEMVILTTGGGILELMEEDVQFLNDMKKTLSRLTNASKKALWENLLRKAGLIPMATYKKYEIDFPFMVNTAAELKDKRKEIEKGKKNDTN